MLNKIICLYLMSYTRTSEWFIVLFVFKHNIWNYVIPYTIHYKLPQIDSLIIPLIFFVRYSNCDTKRVSLFENVAAN